MAKYKPTDLETLRTRQHTHQLLFHAHAHGAGPQIPAGGGTAARKGPLAHLISKRNLFTSIAVKKPNGSDATPLNSAVVSSFPPTSPSTPSERSQVMASAASWVFDQNRPEGARHAQIA